MEVQGHKATSNLVTMAVLYGHNLTLPHSMKTPFLIACLPKAITENNLPFMTGAQGIATCRSIVLPKDSIQPKVKKGSVEGKETEYFLISKVKDDVWICLSVVGCRLLTDWRNLALRKVRKT